MKGSNFMSKETLEFIQEKAKELIAAPSCSAEAKEAAQAWLAAVGTDKQAEETKKFIAEMEEDIIPIDGLIAFRRIRMPERKVFRRSGKSQRYSGAWQRN